MTTEAALRALIERAEACLVDKARPPSIGHTVEVNHAFKVAALNPALIAALARVALAHHEGYVFDINTALRHLDRVIKDQMP